MAFIGPTALSDFRTTVAALAYKLLPFGDLSINPPALESNTLPTWLRPLRLNPYETVQLNISCFFLLQCWQFFLVPTSFSMRHVLGSVFYKPEPHKAICSRNCSIVSLLSRGSNAELTENASCSWCTNIRVQHCCKCLNVARDSFDLYRLRMRDSVFAKCCKVCNMLQRYTRTTFFVGEFSYF